jgi:alkylation response protein AidB-like acyl-CoA dehydrogenase
MFASGGRHATWLGGHCVVIEADGSPRRDADGQPIERTMLFPRSSVPLIDVWDVIGLRGTGSDSYAVTDRFVPEAYTLGRDQESDRRESGTLYRFSTTNIYAASFAAVALGIARATLDAFIALAREKASMGSGQTLRDNEVIQSAVAQAEARLGASRAYLLQSLTDIYADVAISGRLTLDQRMRIRLASTYAIHEAKSVVDTAYQEAGATAIFARNPFERRFRDMHSVSQQQQGRRAHFETVGQHMLGLRANTRNV